MRVAYLDCATGISGDMILAALIDAGIEPETIRAGIASLHLPGVELLTREVHKEGFRAIHVRVEHPEQHAHRHLADILDLIEAADGLNRRQKDLACRIFRALAAAEAKVHGTSLEKVHFHEVGAVDSIVDVVGAAIGFEQLAADQIVASPIPTGRGEVKIDHGICPIPTPGTAELLKGVPLRDVPVEAELTTPTGAALVTTLVDRFAALPEMRIESIGYGAGSRDIAGRANMLRLFLGTADGSPETDQVFLLETNLDDVSAEVVGYAKEKLFAAGALEVYTTPIQMKKDRPGVLLSVICRPADREPLEAILFAETATFGVRRHLLERSKRLRQEHTVQTPWGPVRGKLGWRHDEPAVFVPEFDACAALAAHNGVPLRDVYRAAEAAFGADASHPVKSPDSQSDSGEVHHHDHDHHHHHHDHDHDHDHD